MKRTTQKEIILKVLRELQDWKVSYELEKVNTKWGWLGTSALKRCRELEVDKQIEKTYKDGYVWYRATAPKTFTEYRVNGELIHTSKEYGK